MPTDNRQKAARKDCAVEIQTLGVFILTTCVQDSLMTAAHTARGSAMEAAVAWVEGEAEARLRGSLEEQSEGARRFVEGRGGQMEIIGSLLLGQTQRSSEDGRTTKR